MWTEKYRPKRLDELFGNKNAVEEVRKFDWKRTLLIHGGAGVGKTALVEALASELELELVELDADNVGEAAAIASTGSLYGRERLVLVDNADKFPDMRKLAAFMEDSMVKVVLTTTDVKSKRLVTIKKMCHEVQLRRQQPAAIAGRLDAICRSENVSADKEALLAIAGNSGGDIRSAITDLETASTGKKNVTKKDVEGLYERDAKGDIYKTLGVVFNGRDINEIVGSTWDLDSEPRNTIFWIEENAPNLIHGVKQLSSALRWISRAETFLTRAEGSRYWGFWRYANALMTAGVNASIDKHSYSMYRFPSYFMAMSRSKPDRAFAKGIGGKIGGKVHESSLNAARDYVPLFRILLKKSGLNPDALKREYMLSDEEMEYLTGS
jgi:replication factor C large subunit